MKRMPVTYTYGDSSTDKQQTDKDKSNNKNFKESEQSYNQQL